MKKTFVVLFVLLSGCIWSVFVEAQDKMLKVDRAVIETSYKDLAIQGVADAAYEKLIQKMQRDVRWFSALLVLGLIGAALGGNILIQRAVESISRSPVEKIIVSLEARKDELQSIIAESKIRANDQLKLFHDIERKTHKLDGIRAELEKKIGDLESKLSGVDEKLDSVGQEIGAAQELINDKVNSEIKIAAGRIEDLANALRQTLQDKDKIDEYLAKAQAIDRALESSRAEFQRNMSVSVRIRYDVANFERAEILRNFLVSQGYKAFIVKIQNPKSESVYRVFSSSKFSSVAKKIVEQIGHIVKIRAFQVWGEPKTRLQELIRPAISITLMGPERLGLLENLKRG